MRRRKTLLENYDVSSPQEWIQMKEIRYVNNQLPQSYYPIIQEAPKIPLRQNLIQQKSTQFEYPQYIYLNGNVYKDVKAKQPIKKITIPDMKVFCNNCQTGQLIPGLCEKFICCKCAQMNKCHPIYSFVVCKECQKKVLYKILETSLIKCPKCKQIWNINCSNKQLKEQVSTCFKDQIQIPNQQSLYQFEKDNY